MACETSQVGGLKSRKGGSGEREIGEGFEWKKGKEVAEAEKGRGRDCKMPFWGPIPSLFADSNPPPTARKAFD